MPIDSLLVLLLAEIRPAIQEPFPSPEQIWAIGAALLGVWLFAIGASVGSFVNVVVYRLPLGLSLSNPGSRCPRCLHPIRLQHNVPILGWLLLRGRCADCQLPISPRYPRVEFLFGLIFLVVGGVEMLGNGVNFPRPSAELSRQALSTQDSYALGAATATHLVLIATLVCAALIEFDGQNIPRRVVLPVFLVAIGASLMWPAVHPLAALELLNTSPEYRNTPVFDLVFGVLGGGIAVAFVQFTIGSLPWMRKRYGEIIPLFWIALGIVFGWQLIPLLLALWSALQIANVGEKLSFHPVRDLALVTLPAMLAWRWISGYPQVIDASLYGQVAAYVITLLIALILLIAAAARLPKGYEFPQPIVDEAFQPTPPPPADATTIEDSAPSLDEPPSHD